MNWRERGGGGLARVRKNETLNSQGFGGNFPTENERSETNTWQIS